MARGDTPFAGMLVAGKNVKTMIGNLIPSEVKAPE